MSSKPPVLGDFPPELERLTNVRAGDLNPLEGAGGGLTARGARILFGELRDLHNAVRYLLDQDAERRHS